MSEQSVYAVTKKIIYTIGNENHPDVEVLASLRNSNDILSLKAAPAWGMILGSMDPKYFNQKSDGEPSYAEKAIFTALRAYALHQRTNPKLVHVPYRAKGMPLFTALNKTREQTTKSKKALDCRVKGILAYQDFGRIATELISLVNIMDGQKFNFKIDFALLAQDLYSMQFNNTSQRQIALKWGQQYFKNIYKIED